MLMIGENSCYNILDYVIRKVGEIVPFKEFNSIVIPILPY